MSERTPIAVKICCIQNLADARRADAEAAALLGLVADMPSGPGVLSDPAIQQINQAIGTDGLRAQPVLLTARTEPHAIAEHATASGVSIVQIVQEIDPAGYAALRRALPETKLIQVLHVEDGSAIERARHYHGLADALLLDSGRPGAAVAELGGTGRTHDWSVSREIVAQAPVPVLLAGGLNPANVVEAVQAVQPAGVDLCSGIRDAGALQPAKLAGFMAALRLAGFNPTPLSAMPFWR